MGHQKKGFNAKARRVSSPNHENKTTQESSIIVQVDDKEKYDASNPLVFIPTKNKLKVKEKKQSIPKPLTKKQRKKLEKVIQAKKKKQNRAELLRKLSEVQATNEDLHKLTSTADMQTYGVKRLSCEVQSSAKRRKISNLKGINKASSKDSSSSSESEEEENSGQNEIDSSDDDQIEQAVSEENKCDSPQNTGNDNLPMNQTNEKETEKQPVIGEEKKSVLIPTVFVPVNRNPEIQAAREALPIYSEEQPLIEAIKENKIVIVHGETGSGKTTQVPQFLYEAGFTQNNMLIGITEPRRIAAMTMAARVGEEMNMPDAVSYHIRYEKNVNPETQIKFMTDGILLKEIRQDFYLSKYSVIIIDEAHERSAFSDVLIGFLSRIVHRDEKKDKNYPPLRLIIMSATMCVEEFLDNRRLFRTNPFLFKVSSRQYDVRAHFNKHTPEDYNEAAYHKVCKIHKQLPPGTILVFMTGEKEINDLCRRLRKTFPFKKDSNKSQQDVEPAEEKKSKKKRKKEQHFLPDIDLDDFAVEPIEEKDPTDPSSVGDGFPDEKFQPLYALPLYSELPLEQQEKVFKPPPAGSRLCVVATNVAETSITIPGLKYVVDTGKVKTRVYSESGGISRYVVTWCSKASANQRAGRAGRTEGGHCYRLYSSAMFENDFPDFSPPEIQIIPADNLVLQMKSFGIRKVMDFPFPTPLDVEALKAAEKRLVLLGALEDLSSMKGRYIDYKNREFSAPITPLGKAMALFPLSPRYSNMLLLSKKHQCVPHATAVICAMTISDIFRSKTVTVDEDSEDTKVVYDGIKKIGAGQGDELRLGDAMVYLRSVALCEEAEARDKQNEKQPCHSNKRKFCNKFGIKQKAMIEIQKMRMQLLKEMNHAFATLNLPLELRLEPPNEDIVDTLRKIVFSGLADHIARRMPVEEGKKDKHLKNAYQCLELEDPVFIHPSSILFGELPEYVVYQEIIHTSKYYMKGLVEIEPSWIPHMFPSLCEFSEPKEKFPPTYDSDAGQVVVTRDVKVGRWSWEFRVEGLKMPAQEDRYSWFSFFLLDGQVCPFIKEYSKLLEPSLVLKSWALKFRPNIKNFLFEVMTNEVDSKKALEAKLRNNPNFLLKEFLDLLPSSKRTEFEVEWQKYSSSLKE